MPTLTVTTIDLSILIAYVIGSRLIFGWTIARQRRQRDTKAYFLGGRNIHWVLIGLSFYVSNMSGSTFVGLPGSGYLNGIAVYHDEWLAAGNGSGGHGDAGNGYPYRCVGLDPQ